MPRNSPLPDEFTLDEEEERLRDAKAQEKVRMRDKAPRPVIHACRVIIRGGGG